MENVMDYNNIFLGGKEVVIGGWGEYEVHKRAMRAKLNGDNYDKYYSKKYIYPQHIVDSILGGSRHKSSYDAINRFIGTLRSKESKNVDFNNVWVMPALTSSRLSNFVQEDMYDIDEMQKMNLFLRDYADMMNLQVPLESLSHLSLVKERPVHISNNTGLMELEERMIPNINTVERNLAILATNCDKVRKAVTRRKERFGFDSSDSEGDSDTSGMSGSGSSSGNSDDLMGGNDNIKNNHNGTNKNNKYDNEFMKYIYGNKNGNGNNTYANCGNNDNYDSIDPNCYRDEDIDDTVEINAAVGGDDKDNTKEEKIENEKEDCKDNKVCVLAFIIDK